MLMESRNKLSRVKCWLSLAMLLPLLGSMMEALLIWISDLKLDNWFDHTVLSKTALMTALVVTVLEVLPVTLFYYTCHHIENGWRMPASVCAVLMLAACGGTIALWNEYDPLTLTWYSGVMAGSRIIAGILTVLYAVRLSEKRTRYLSRLALAVMLARTGVYMVSFLPEAAGTVGRAALTQCLTHGIAYTVMQLFLGMACYTGFLPSDRPNAR